MFDKTDTICAPATTLGSGAISVIRISGSNTMNVVDKVVKFKKGTASESKGGRIKFGTISNNDSSILDEVLVSIFKAPYSYTGEDAAEISCHASSYIVSEILRLLMEAGCRMAMPGEFTQRAFINGKMDLTQAEAVADVISSTTEASHRVAFKQLKGGFSSELTKLRAQLLEMASLLELELDFSEEDVEFADRQRINTLLEQTLERIDGLAKSFKLGNAIKNGVPVAIVGAANAGKSTLLNAILGENRAIVSEIAGTTRDTIEQTYNIDGVLFRFIDTAGIREHSQDVIERIGIERSFASIEKAEIILLLVDCIEPNFESVETVLRKVDFKSQDVVVLLNKCDGCCDGNCDDGCDDGRGIYCDDNCDDGCDDKYDDGRENNCDDNCDDGCDENCQNNRKNGINKNVTIPNNIVSYIENKKFISDSDLNRLSVLKISAKTGEGLKNLLHHLSESQKNKLGTLSESSVLVTNLRHYQALVDAAENLRLVQSGILLGSPTDIIAEDLRSALTTLGTITGEISTTEVLGNIFSKFCIGK